jgi:hypothetical protein
MSWVANSAVSGIPPARPTSAFVTANGCSTSVL